MGMDGSIWPSTKATLARPNVSNDGMPPKRARWSMRQSRVSVASSIRVAPGRMLEEGGLPSPVLVLVERKVGVVVVGLGGGDSDGAACSVVQGCVVQG
jgi:hypothetical protein